jgi:F420 biosynthesis protein FbiB-like protein
MTYLQDAMRQRRSIRKYQPKPVPKETVLAVLEAAGQAPSAHNAQPYRFIVLENSAVKQQLAGAMAEAWATDMESDGKAVNTEKRKERANRFANVPILILACTTPVEGLPSYPDERRRSCVRDLAVQSLGAALENLFLTATSMGLGGCWYAAPCFCKGVVRKHLKIPDWVEPQAFIVLGYAAEKPQAPKKKVVEEFCYLDTWGKNLG